MLAKTLLTFGAGIVSFLSPCVLPLVPGYVGYMTGSTTGERVPVRQALPGTLSFVAGLSVVFISLGATASVVSGLLHEHRLALERIAGVFIILLGVLMVSGGRIRLLMRERRFHLRPGRGPLWAFGLGMAFAFGWTPCIGPTLAAALGLAATSDGLGTGIGLLAAYSAGLGIPFVLVGLGLVSVGGRLKRHMLTIQLVGGLLLIGVGILLVSGRLTLLAIWMQRVLTNAGLAFWNF